MEREAGFERGLPRTILALAWPVMLEEALQTIVMYADAAMVGRVGVAATASVGLTTSTIWLLNSVPRALGVGFLACIARAIGAGDDRRARKAAMQAIWLALGLGIAMTAIVEGMAPFLPYWLGADEEIRADGAMYFAIVTAPTIFRTLSYIMGSCLRACGDTRTPMRVNLGMNAINIVLNMLLIFPTRMMRLGAFSMIVPGAGLGVKGAAIATALSITFSGCMMLRYVWCSERIGPRGMRLRVDEGIMGDCVKVGIPIMLENLGVFSGHILFTAQITYLGKTALAAHSIALTAEEAFYIPGYGMEAAASTLAGQALGRRSERELDRSSRMVLATSMSLMTLTGLFLFAFPEFMMRFFTTDAAVIRAGARVLRIVACSEPIYSAMIIIEGVYHGVGQTRYPFVTALATMWGIRILGTVICVRLLGLGLTAAWLCMVGDNVTRALLLAVRFFRGSWKRELGLSRT